MIPSPLLPSRRRYLFTRSDVHSLKRSRNTHKGRLRAAGHLGGSMEMLGAASSFREAAPRRKAGRLPFIRSGNPRVRSSGSREAMAPGSGAP